MNRITFDDYITALALFRDSGHQMKLDALAEGRIEAAVWTDGPNPAATAVLYGSKLMLATRLPAVELAPVLRPFLLEQVYERRMGCDAGEALLFWDGDAAREALAAALEDKSPATVTRQYYELADPALCRPVSAPQGYALVPVDAALLAAGYGRTDALLEEMCSERRSVEDFVAKSFGVAAVKDNELVGWCLSEYNCRRGCEIGIEVAESHRRQGLALAMVSAFAIEAGARGLQSIGWHCMKSNLASSATARSAGFVLRREYGEMLCTFELAAQYAVNGYFADGEGRLEEAVGWFRRAVALPGVPWWAFVRLAMALTTLGDIDAAFGVLRQGLENGLDARGWLENEPRLEGLRRDPRWETLLQ